MIIYILIGEDKFSIEVIPSYTIEYIKMKIFDIKNIPIDFQRLFFNSVELEDSKNLIDYNIYDSSEIKLEEKNEIDINVIYGQSLNKIDTFKLKDSIKSVKEKIEEKINIISEKQILVFENKELEDNKSLIYYNLDKGLKKKTFELFIGDKNGIKVYLKRDSGKILNYSFNPSLNIGNIKKKICEEEKLSEDILRLEFEGNELENNQTLEYYNIRNKQTINLKLVSRNGIIILIQRPTGKIINLDVSQSATIYDIKCQIQNYENLPIINQKIKYNKNELNDDKTLYDYEIKHESVLECIYKNEEGFQIFFNGFDGITRTICVNLNTTIENIKEIIYEKTGIRLNKQRLIFAGKQLEDQRTIQYYNLQRECTLQLVSRLRGGIKIFFNNN